MKSIIVIYDDLCELDRTEVTYNGEAQLKTIVSSLLQDQPDAEVAEVYNKISQDLIVSYKRTRSGQLVEKERARPKRKTRRVYERKPAEEKMPVQIFLNVKSEMKEYLDKVLGHEKNAWIRQAINEKIERENGVIPLIQQREEGHPDRRYHRMFKGLPYSIRTYKERETYRSPLTIVKYKDVWRVSYGMYIDNVKGAPSVENKDLLSALEWMDRWLKEHNNKWCIA